MAGKIYSKPVTFAVVATATVLVGTVVMMAYPLVRPADSPVGEDRRRGRGEPGPRPDVTDRRFVRGPERPFSRDPPYFFTSTIFSPRQIATIGLATKMDE